MMYKFIQSTIFYKLLDIKIIKQSISQQRTKERYYNTQLNLINKIYQNIKLLLNRNPKLKKKETKSKEISVISRLFWLQNIWRKYLKKKIIDIQIYINQNTKRTKETIFREHPDCQQRQGINCLKEFDGEDLQFDSRNKFNKDQQKQWIFEQIDEKKRRQEQEKAEEMLYAQQTLEINRFRGMLQDNFTSRKTDIGVAKKPTIFNQAKEKKDKEEREKQEKLAAECAERDLLLERGRKQPLRDDQQLICFIFLSIISYNIKYNIQSNYMFLIQQLVDFIFDKSLKKQDQYKCFHVIQIGHDYHHSHLLIFF